MPEIFSQIPTNLCRTNLIPLNLHQDRTAHPEDLNWRLISVPAVQARAQNSEELSAPALRCLDPVRTSEPSTIHKNSFRHVAANWELSHVFEIERRASMSDRIVVCLRAFAACLHACVRACVRAFVWFTPEEHAEYQLAMPARAAPLARWNGRQHAGVNFSVMDRSERRMCF